MRFHKKTLPSPNDIVFVSPISFSENGVFCKLLEYDGKEGLILSTEIVRKWTDSKNNQKTFKYDKIYAVVVLEATNKHIDLSYRKVAPEDREKFVNNFAYFKKIVHLVDEMVFFTGLDEKMMYEKFVWTVTNGDHMTLYNNILRDPYNLVKMYLDEHLENVQAYANYVKGHIKESLVHKIIKEYMNDCSDEVNGFIDNMKSRITGTNIVMARGFQLYVFDVEGIYKLKKILSDGFSFDVEIRYICSPRYQIVGEGQNLASIEEIIERAMEVLKINAGLFKSSLVFDDENVEIRKQEFSLRSLDMREEGEKGGK